MKLIRSGGTNSSLTKDQPEYYTHGYGNSVMVQIKPTLDALIEEGGEIAICVAAKPDKHHYDQRLLDAGFRLEELVILGREDGAAWSQYSAVIMLGGETRALYSWLIRTQFSIESLTQCSILVGDSAGAYVLSGKFLMDYTPDGKSFEIHDGFIPSLNQLIASHANNTYYHQADAREAFSKWCKDNGCEFIPLEENEINFSEIFI